MLTENEIMDRACFCYGVCLQLNWVLSNDLLSPPEYLKALENSSLGLAGDEFIRQSIGEALASGEEDGGLNSLIMIYESFTLAYCEVLEIGMDDLRQSIPPEHLSRLASEVGAEAKAEAKIDK